MRERGKPGEFFLLHKEDEDKNKNEGEEGEGEGEGCTLLHHVCMRTIQVQ
jgi:hypothetical protein